MMYRHNLFSLLLLVFLFQFLLIIFLNNFKCFYSITYNVNNKNIRDKTKDIICFRYSDKYIRKSPFRLKKKLKKSIGWC